MFNLGAGEIAVIMIVALLLLGPDKLPELARGIGKFVREFRRQTDDVRGMVEREFYKMDQEVFAEEQAQAKRIEPPAPAAAGAPGHGRSGGRARPADLPLRLPPAGGRGRRAAELGGAARLRASRGRAGRARRRSASEPVVSARPEGDPPAHG